MSDIAKWNGIAVAGISKWNGIAVAGIAKLNGFAWPTAGGWLAGWTYRKSVTLSRASGAVTNYQMKLLVGESSGATGEDVDCGALCKTDFSDLRFTTSDGVTLLDYWIESVSGTTDDQLATIWIEFDFIDTTDTTFYMYYGNAGAAAYSDGDDTFLFFDDFPGVALDGTKWNGSGSVGSSLLTLASGEITSKTTYGANTRFRGLMKYGVNSTYMKFGYYNTSSYGCHFYANYTTGSVLNACNWNPHGTMTNTNLGNVGHNAYNIFDVKRNGTTNVLFEINDGNVATNTTNVPTSTTLTADIHAQSQTVYSQWVFISQFLGTEPAWGAWGAQEP
jgi:hypothetical protein